MSAGFVRHTVFVWLRADVSAADMASVHTKIQALRQHPDLNFLSYSAGVDLKLADGNPSFVISGDFASVDDYKHYAQHPDHVAFVTFLKTLMQPDHPPVRAQYWVEHQSP